MKKCIFIIALFFFGFTQLSHAQESPVNFGVRGGINIADWRGDAAESFSSFADKSGVFKVENLTGYHFGGYATIPLSPIFTIEPGLNYSVKGMKVSQSIFEAGFLNLKGEISSRLHYIELPVMAKVNITPGFHVYGGPQVAYLASSKLKAEAGILGFSVGKSFDVNSGFRDFDFGVVGGLGYEFMNGINIRAGYEHGLSTLDEGNPQINAYNRVIKFSLGYTF